VTILPREFFAQPTLTVAQNLLGQHLVRAVEGQHLRGRIVETEAYLGPEDTACHASKGRTPRTEVMFGPPGRTYVYLIYGLHYMLNLVTEVESFPAAVLIRAIEPLAGLDLMRQHRQRQPSQTMPLRQIGNGPGKLCQALRIDKSLNGWDVTTGQTLWLEAVEPLPKMAIASGPRLGIDYAQAADRAAPWRFWQRDNPFISK
jgi:DNA-3-methyladenine glycosylase